MVKYVYYPAVPALTAGQLVIFLVLEATDSSIQAHHVFILLGLYRVQVF